MRRSQNPRNDPHGRKTNRSCAGQPHQRESTDEGPRAELVCTRSGRWAGCLGGVSAICPRGGHLLRCEMAREVAILVVFAVPFHLLQTCMRVLGWQWRTPLRVGAWGERERSPAWSSHLAALIATTPRRQLRPRPPSRPFSSISLAGVSWRLLQQNSTVFSWLETTDRTGCPPRSSAANSRGRPPRGPRSCAGAPWGRQGRESTLPKTLPISPCRFAISPL